MNRIEKKFKELKRLKKKAFIAFITAGYPSLEVTRRLILEFFRIGVDIIELGIPFSDPIADGEMIQEASQKALEKKVDLDKVFRLVRELRKSTQIPVCFMSYYNPVFCYGEKRFLRQARVSGVDGVIIPDLSGEEAKAFARLAKKDRIDTIFFISPTTSRERMRQVAKISSGFVYYVSLTGVTGTRQILAADISRHLKTVKRYVAKPVCVGFGISSPEQVKKVSALSDGAIVGSAIVKKIKENIGRADLVKKVGAFVAGLM